LEEKKNSCLLPKIAENFEYHLDLIGIGFTGFTSNIIAYFIRTKLVQFILRFFVMNEDDVIPNASDVSSILRRRCINEVRIHEMAHERRYLRPHTVLLGEGFMRISL
jgi:hypothetical protein